MFLFLIGALTAKSHSFTTRSWELQNIETIDIFDSLCSNIRIDVKGSDIIRILPINNKFVNEEWISDKTRFGYDSLKRWRFIYPMLKINNTFIQSSWNNLFNILKKKIKINDFENIIIKTSSFTDLETLVTLQSFCDKNNNVIINTELNMQSDLINYFLNIEELERNKVYLFVGNNLRYENPLLNIRFKKLNKIKSILIGYIGYKYDINFTMLHLGITLKIFRNIFEGKHIFIKLVNAFSKNNLNSKNLFKYKFSFIFGKDFANKINSNKLNKFLQNSIDKKFCYTFQQESVGKLNVLNLCVKNLKKINKNKSNFYYILGAENIKNINSKDFIIFQGHHNDKIRLKFNIILPTVIWTEKSSLYFNVFGFVQRSNFVITPPINTRIDWKLIRILSIIFNKDITYKSNIQIYKRLNQLIPNFKNSIFNYNKNSKYKIRYVIKQHMKLNFTDENPFVTFCPYYYFLNSVERASKTLNFVLINCKKDESNFI